MTSADTRGVMFVKHESAYGPPLYKPWHIGHWWTATLPFLNFHESMALMTILRIWRLFSQKRPISNRRPSKNGSAKKFSRF